MPLLSLKSYVAGPAQLRSLHAHPSRPLSPLSASPPLWARSLLAALDGGEGLLHLHVEELELHLRVLARLLVEFGERRVVRQVELRLWRWGGWEVRSIARTV